MTQTIELQIQALRELRARIKDRHLEDDDWRVFAALVQSLEDRAEARVARMLAKILAAAAGSTESGTHQSPLSGSGSNKAQAGAGSDHESTSSKDAADASHTQQNEDDPETAGHGRNGAASFTGASHIYHELLAGIIGMICAACKAGTMQPYREKLVIRIVGQPLFGAEVHHCEQARCRICGRIARASLPFDVTEGIGSSYINYHWSACAMLAVMHYFAGLPFKRIESLHEGWGIPFSDANQWNMMDEADGLLLPLFNRLEKYGIEHGESIRIDDTGSDVIEIQKMINSEIKACETEGRSIKEIRTGINATAAYIEAGDETIALYYTGRHHAGEIFGQMLDKRRQLKAGSLVKITDGASKNFMDGPGDDLTEAACNAHALLKFRDIKDKFPEEYAVAGAVYKQVFDNDDTAKARNLNPTERMEFHKKHSLPLMHELKAMCTGKLESKLVEPRSPLWQPITFILNQWPRLVRFCEVSGVPLDTNLVEQALIIPVRYLAASFNYKTINGAEVGDRFMSLIVTALKNDVEPVEFLTHCLEHHEELKTNPEKYLPWVYRDRMDDRDKPSSESS